MTTGKEFVEAVNLIEDSIPKIGHDLGQEIVQNIGGSDIIVGHVGDQGSYRYQVVGQPNTHYFTIEFPFEIPRDLGSLLEIEIAEEILRDKEYNDDVDITRLAAYEILEQMSTEHREKFKFELTRELSTTDTAFNFMRTDSGTVAGFVISRKIFPFREEFSLREFNHSVQSVINCGNRGVQFVGTTFDFEGLMASQTAEDGGHKESPRYLQ